MKYYIYCLDDDNKTEKEKDIFYLNKEDTIWMGGNNYSVHSKTIDYDENEFHVNVILDN